MFLELSKVTDFSSFPSSNAFIYIAHMQFPRAVSSADLLGENSPHIFPLKEVISAI